MAAIHTVAVQRRGDALELALEYASGDRRSIAHEALVRQLRVRAGDTLHRLDSTTSSLTLPAAAAIEILVADTISPAPLSMASLEIDGDAIRELHGAPRYRLSPFELRYAADAGAIHPVPRGARVPLRWKPITDLHSHFAGCVRGAALIELALQYELRYPCALLAEARIHVEAPADAVPLASLGPKVLERLASRLEVPLDRRVTFLEMEQIYRLRAPLTKAPSLFVPLCRRIAADYASMGVRYVELSLGSIVEARVLREVHRAVPQIEEESGVTMRFLAAISRHDDPEWDLDLLERLKALAGSDYLVGVDFMGHETNSTHAFAPILKAITTWANRARPGFVVRVHAGESPSHPENVRVAVEATRGHDVQLRVGHGLYGVDDATLDAIVSTGTIVEFNLDSNVALNHLQSARAVPLERYVEAGARIVLGSDGYGIYGSTPEASAQAALVAGLSPIHLETALADTERRCLDEVGQRSARREFDVPDDPAPVFFTPAVLERRRRAVAVRDEALEARLRAVGARVVGVSEIATLLGSRMLVSIAGAWKQSWEAMLPAERERAEREMSTFVAGLDPTEALLVTGGTCFGIEGLVGRAARRRGLEVLAAIVRATPPDGLDPDAMTHACFVGETLYDKAAGLYEIVDMHAGACIFVAGGQIVSDEIQTAQNARLRYLLMGGVSGASSKHGRERPARVFHRAAEALQAIRSWRALPPEIVPHWYEGANPTVDAVVTRSVGDVREVLLVLRDRDAPAEPGKWALPGGFIASDAPRGGPWSAAESEIEACVREVSEETGLAIDPNAVVRLGVFEGGGRDPRDTARSWSRGTAFLVDLGRSGEGVIAGGDDAEDARWFPLDAPPSELAFDHARILECARARMREDD